jgi:hypothetical protein
LQTGDVLKCIEALLITQLCSSFTKARENSLVAWHCYVGLSLIRLLSLIFHGRFQLEKAQRPVEQLQQRFYSVVSKLQTAKPAEGQVAGGSASNEPSAPGLNVFNLQYEQHRRRQVVCLIASNYISLKSYV